MSVIARVKTPYFCRLPTPMIDGSGTGSPVDWPATGFVATHLSMDKSHGYQHFQLQRKYPNGIFLAYISSKIKMGTSTAKNFTVAQYHPNPH
ncbi:MAG: hypothetical protein P8Z73_06220 [Desulfobacteraceae bacterium]|jgi:hypothetical protein